MKVSCLVFLWPKHFPASCYSYVVWNVLIDQLIILLEEEISYSYWAEDGDLQWSDGDACDSDGSVPSPSSAVPTPQTLIFRSGGIVRKVRLGLQDFVQRKKNYRLILRRIRQKMTTNKGIRWHYS